MVAAGGVVLEGHQAKVVAPTAGRYGSLDAPTPISAALAVNTAAANAIMRCFSSNVHLVVSANLVRRHLDTSQRAMIAGGFAQMPNHRPREDDKERKSATSLSVDGAAELLNVSKDVVKDARAVLAAGDPQVIAAVEVSVPNAVIPRLR